MKKTAPVKKTAYLCMLVILATGCQKYEAGGKVGCWIDKDADGVVDDDEQIFPQQKDDNGATTTLEWDQSICGPENDLKSEEARAAAMKVIFDRQLAMKDEEEFSKKACDKAIADHNKTNNTHAVVKDVVYNHEWGPNRMGKCNVGIKQ